MPLMYDVNYTFGGRFSCFLSFKLGLKGKWIDSQLDKLAEIEGAKYFGGTHFDIVLNYSNLDKKRGFLRGAFIVFFSEPHKIVKDAGEA